MTTDRTYTNPWGIPDMGYPTAIPVMLAVECPYSPDYALALRTTVWNIWNQHDPTAQSCPFRLTFNRPQGPFANYGVVRAVERAINPMHGLAGLTPVGLWTTIPNYGLTERAAWATWTGDPAATAQTMAHEMGHAMGLSHVVSQPGNLMTAGGAAEWTLLTPDQITQRDNCFRWWRGGLLP